MKQTLNLFLVTLLGLVLAACGSELAPTDLTAQAALPGDASVCFYEHNDFFGASLCRNADDGDASKLTEFNNLITSVQVAPGYEVVLYPKFNFKGRSLTLSKNDTNLTGENFNDRTSSFKIRKTDGGDDEDDEGDEGGATKLDQKCTPEVTLNLEDEDSYRSGLFLDAAGDDPEAFLQDIGRKVCRTLYQEASEVRDANRLELILRNAVGGVAWKSGNIGDITIMISTDHLSNVSTKGEDVAKEIKGILFHEMTHMYQQDDTDGGGADLGLIEGIADAVRFKNGFTPEGAQPSKDGNWNDGYRTTAFFLLWLDERYESFLYELNLSMSNTDEERWSSAAFEEITGKPVDQLWSDYLEDADEGADEGGDIGSSAAPPKMVVKPTLH